MVFISLGVLRVNGLMRKSPTCVYAACPANHKRPTRIPPVRDWLVFPHRDGVPRERLYTSFTGSTRGSFSFAGGSAATAYRPGALVVAVVLTPFGRAGRGVIPVDAHLPFGRGGWLRGYGICTDGPEARFPLPEAPPHRLFWP